MCTLIKLIQLFLYMGFIISLWFMGGDGIYSHEFNIG